MLDFKDKQLNRKGMTSFYFHAGGKTVVLKTLGLVALMVRAGIPIPAASGARVDLFDPVLADIGDLQSVTGDLSTFSGHLVVSCFVCNCFRTQARPRVASLFSCWRLPLRRRGLYLVDELVCLVS